MQLTVPYCSVPEFREYPTMLDTLDLRVGDGSLAHQDAILNKVLLVSTRWVDNYCELGDDGTLTAHTRVENKRMRPDRYGRLVWHPDHLPFVSLQSVAVGTNLASLTTYTSPALFVEDRRSVVVDLQGGNSSWSGSLQFGGPAPGCDLYASWSYTAGFPNTLLTSGVTAGATSLPVADMTGVQPGQTLRIYDPGADENITIAGTWAPTTGPGTLPLTSGVLNGHTILDATTQIPSPVRVSAMGGDILEATVNYGIALLLRPDSTAEDAFPDLRGGASTRLADSRRDGSGLIFESQHLLEPYRRVI